MYIKLTLGGAILFILVAVSCYFWYRWETQPYREEYEKTQQFLREWTTPQDIIIPVQAAENVEGQDGASVEQKSVSAQRSINKTALHKLDTIPKQQVICEACLFPAGR